MAREPPEPLTQPVLSDRARRRRHCHPRRRLARQRRGPKHRAVDPARPRKRLPRPPGLGPHTHRGRLHRLRAPHHDRLPRLRHRLWRPRRHRHPHVPHTRRHPRTPLGLLRTQQSRHEHTRSARSAPPNRLPPRQHAPAMELDSLLIKHPFRTDQRASRQDSSSDAGPMSCSYSERAFEMGALPSPVERLALHTYQESAEKTLGSARRSWSYRAWSHGLTILATQRARQSCPGQRYFRTAW